MNFTKLSWKNLFSYGDYETEIILDQDGITFVRGVNKDTNTSNGSGKSSVIDVFSWVLFGKPLKTIPIDSIKNNHSRGAGHAHVEFWINDDYYTIDRYRGSKEFGNGVVIKRNNTELENATPKDAQARIDSIIGLDYQSFVSSLIFSSEITFAFPTLTADKRREYIETIMGIGDYSGYGKEARKRVRKLRKELNEIEVSLKEKKKFTEKERDDYVKYQEMHADFDKITSGKIESLLDKVEEIEERIDKTDASKRDELSEALQALLDTCAEISEGIAEAAKHKADESHELKDITWEEQKLESESNNQVDDLSKKLRKQLKELDKKIELVNHACPTCERGWEPDQVETLTEQYTADRETVSEQINDQIALVEETFKSNHEKLVKKKESIESKIEKLTKKDEKLQAQRDSIQEEIKEIEDSLEKLPTQEQYNEWLNEKKLLEQEIAQLEKAQSPYAELLENLQGKIEELVEEIDELKEHRSDLEGNLKYANFWDESFNQDGLKLFIFQNIVPVMNSRIAHYLPLLFDGKDISLEFDNHMNMAVIKEGKPLPYGGLSKGERKRVDLTISLALLETAQAQHGVTSNVMFFDEIFDSSLDSHGVKTVTEILHTMPVQSIFVISHRLEISNSFDNTLDVVKEGKFSKILA